MKKKKKKIYSFLIKNNFICWTRLKTEKHLGTVKQLIRKCSVCQSEHTKRLDHPPLIVFIGFLRIPLTPLQETYFLNDPKN